MTFELDPPHSLDNPNWVFDFVKERWILLPKPWEKLWPWQRWYYLFVKPELDIL